MTNICSYSPDGNSGKFSNGFTWKKQNSGNQIEIINSNSDVIYRGSLKMNERNLENIYIELSDYITTKSNRIIYMKDMNMLPENLICTKENKLLFDPSLQGKRVVLIEITPFYDSHQDTDLIIIDYLINTDSFCIDIEELNLKDKDFVVWIENNCLKINT